MRALSVAGLALFAAAACAGDLKDPERFAFLDDAGAMAVRDAATGGHVPDAGVPDAGGAGGGPDAGAVPACVTAIFETKCGSSVCHDATAPQVDLISDGVAGRLVDRPAPASGLCGGRLYVASDGSPSLLLDKLGETPPCGSRMPLVGNNLMAADITCLTNWVASIGGGS